MSEETPLLLIGNFQRAPLPSPPILYCSSSPMPPSRSIRTKEDTIASRTRGRHVLSQRRLKKLVQSQNDEIIGNSDTAQSKQPDLRPQSQKDALLLWVFLII
jgi:hypothetical protein